MSDIEVTRRLAVIETRLDFLVRQADADNGERDMLRHIIEAQAVHGRLLAEIHAVLHPEESENTGPGVRELLHQILAAVESLREPIAQALDRSERSAT